MSQSNNKKSRKIKLETDKMISSMNLENKHPIWAQSINLPSLVSKNFIYKCSSFHPRLCAPIFLREGTDAINKLLFKTNDKNAKKTSRIDYVDDLLLHKIEDLLVMLKLSYSIDLLDLLKDYMESEYIHQLCLAVYADTEELPFTSKDKIKTLLEIMKLTKPSILGLQEVNRRLKKRIPSSKRGSDLCSSQIAKISSTLSGKEIHVYRGFLIPIDASVRLSRKTMEVKDYYSQDSGSGSSYSLSADAAKWFCFRNLFKYPMINDNMFQKYRDELIENIDAKNSNLSDDYKTFLAISSRINDKLVRPVFAKYRVPVESVASVMLAGGEQEIIVKPEDAKLIKYCFPSSFEILQSVIHHNAKEMFN